MSVLAAYTSAFSKKETEASLWAKDHQPKIMIGKDPLGLKKEPSFNDTQIPIFDNILGPSVRLPALLPAISTQIGRAIE